jgi:hypothetical protein
VVVTTLDKAELREDDDKVTEEKDNGEICVWCDDMTKDGGIVAVVTTKDGGMVVLYDDKEGKKVVSAVKNDGADV